MAEIAVTNLPGDTVRLIEGTAWHFYMHALAISTETATFLMLEQAYHNEAGIHRAHGTDQPGAAMPTAPVVEDGLERIRAGAGAPSFISSAAASGLNFAYYNNLRPAPFARSFNTADSFSTLQEYIDAVTSHDRGLVMHILKLNQHLAKGKVVLAGGHAARFIRRHQQDR